MHTPEQGETACLKGRAVTPFDALFTPLLRQLLSEGLSVSFVARGRSMKPFIHDGDVVTVSPIDRHPVLLGSVILHEVDGCPGTVYAHRVVKRDNRADGSIYYTRGDAFWLCTVAVAEDDALGLVSAVQHEGVTHDPQSPPRRLLGLWRGQLRAAVTRLRIRLHGLKK